MELWVRSQDKECLVQVNGLYLQDQNITKEKVGVFKRKVGFNEYKDFLENYEEVIYEATKLITYDGNYLGKYKTKERALEVLDEIQNTMIKTLDAFIEQTDNCAVGYSQFALYEMPKE